MGDMQALLDLVGAKKAIVAGLSLGGYMSLAFNASHPDRVRALMLFDTGPGFKKDEARAKWNETAHQARRRPSTPGARARSISSDEVKLTRHRDATGLAGAARGMLAQQNDRVIQSLDKVAVPTLVLVGANDTNFLAATDYMAAKIRGDQGGHSRRGPCVQPAPARAFQSGSRGVPRQAAGSLRSTNHGQARSQSSASARWAAMSAAISPMPART